MRQTAAAAWCQGACWTVGPTCCLVDALQAPLALLLLERRDLVSVCADKLQLQALRRLHSLQVQVGIPRKNSSLRRDSPWGNVRSE